MDLGKVNQQEMKTRLSSAGKEAIQLWETLRNYPKPIIARINGSAMGGGWGLLFTTDIRIAQKSATFSFSEVKRGIVPAIISAYVVPELGQFRAKQLFLSGERISASRAYEIGFLTEVVEDEEALDKATNKYINMLLENGPSAMAQIKESVHTICNNKHEENILHVLEVFDKSVVTSEEALYGIMCYTQHKTPNWGEFYKNKAKL